MHFFANAQRWSVAGNAEQPLTPFAPRVGGHAGQAVEITPLNVAFEKSSAAVLTTTKSAPYPYRMKKINPLMFVPGTVFWALVIFGTTTKNNAALGVAVVLAVATGIVAITYKARASAAKANLKKQIWTDGRVGVAKILAIGTNGGEMNDNPLVKLDLEVEVDGVPTYLASTEALISKLAIPRIQPECKINVRVARENLQLIVVDQALTPYGYR